MDYTRDYVLRHANFVPISSLTIGDLFFIFDNHELVGFQITYVNPTMRFSTGVVTFSNSLSYTQGVAINFNFNKQIHHIDESIATSTASGDIFTFTYNPSDPKDNSIVLCITIHNNHEGIVSRVISSPDPAQTGSTITVPHSKKIRPSFVKPIDIFKLKQEDLFIIQDKKSKKFDPNYPVYQVKKISITGPIQVNTYPEKSEKNFILKNNTKIIKLKDQTTKL